MVAFYLTRRNTCSIEWLLFSKFHSNKSCCDLWVRCSTKMSLIRILIDPFLKENPWQAWPGWTLIRNYNFKKNVKRTFFTSSLRAYSILPTLTQSLLSKYITDLTREHYLTFYRENEVLQKKSMKILLMKMLRNFWRLVRSNLGV